ncbi:uncharacterized protein LOC130795222 [Actinidia eriantha]|uniref:uncharacterized protein LOC130795222 n=1 Tax=Actinidia eriantha TaxID=165200 RepID=UPI002590BE78|nr:uncharacterized protein LOC130795222 [Actinidia eriantha]XP_057513212.1 uncharacterized protein LOC130795222 [Actinidia eriantha]
MFNSSPQESLQIKQDDKFFSRLLSKESSMSSPSFKVYYGGVSGSVPFLWESQPGTPKHALSDTSLPPLTPPPAYYSHYGKAPEKKHSRSKLLHTLFLRINLKKKTVPSSPSSSLSSSWSSSESSISVPMKHSKYRGRSRFSSVGSSFSGSIDDEEVTVGSTASTLCFGIGREMTGGGLHSAYSVVIMKKALLAMVGRGSS